MTTYITDVRLSRPNPNDHQHIIDARWSQPRQTGTCSRAKMVEFISKGNAVFVRGNPDAQVGVVEGTPPFLRT